MERFFVVLAPLLVVCLVNHAVLSANSCIKLSLTLNGSDTQGCLNSSGNSSCKTLDYVVQHLPKNLSCIDIDVYDNQTLSIPWNITANNFTMQGFGSVALDCQGNQSVIYISNSSDAIIMGILIVNCGIIGNDTHPGTAALTVYNCSTFTITNCSFVNSLSTGLAIMGGNTSGSTIDRRQYTITHSSFINNSVDTMNHAGMFQYPHHVDYLASYGEHEPVFRNEGGGGLRIDVRNSNLLTSITLTNCSFDGNIAHNGGGAYISTSAFTEATTLTMSGCRFINNRAGLLGGGVYISATDDSLLNPETLNLDIKMDNVTFESNSALHAGGLAYRTKPQWSLTANSIIFVKNTEFIKNVADYSGAAFGLFKWEAAGINGITPTFNFFNCTWNNNQIYRTFTDTSSVVGMGALYTQGVSFSLKGITLISNNYGTAVLASASEVYLYGQIVMSRNSGTRGGAVNLVNNARMVVQKGLNLTFADNYADLTGGAVYHTFPVIGVTGQNHYCVFMYYQPDLTDPADWEADIWFIDNKALISGMSLFLSSPDSCKLNDKQKIFTENHTFHFIPSYIDQVTSSPIQILFESTSINCSNYANCWAELMLGEKMTLQLIAMDAFGNNVSGFVAVDISCIHNDSLVPSSECGYRLDGTNLVEFKASSERQQIPFYIAGDLESKYKDHVMLTWQLTELPSAVGYLHVRIKDCYLGYIYDDQRQICVCYNTTDDAIACIDTNYTACVRFGHWYGQFTSADNKNGTDEIQFTTSDCSFGSCDFTVNGECPTEPCDKDGGEYQFYCKLPRDDPNALCLYNKGGVLCSSCQDGYAPSFPNGLKCVKQTSCHLSYVALQAILYLSYLIILVLLVIFVVKMNLRIGSGQIYGLVFYFSVFKYFVGGVFPSEFLYIIEIFFTGLVQFDPTIIGMIPMCSMETSVFLGRLLQLINPAFLIVVIIIILYVSRKWPRYALLPNTNLGTNALCVMLYLCFISITQTTLALLNPLKLPGIKGVYTFLDPTKHYFGSHHWPYGLISLVLQLVLVIPFLGLLLFSPFLIRFRWLNLTRIKPILDEFQACYKTEYRYFAGFYLACRQLIFIISFINLGAFAYIYILQFLSIFILTLHLTVQPYKNKALNILDGLLILDLVFLSLLHGNTAAVVFDDVISLKIGFIYILVLLPVLYLAVLCLRPIIKYCSPRIKNFKFKYQRLNLRKLKNEENGRMPSHGIVTTTTVSLSNDDNDDDRGADGGLARLLMPASPKKYKSLEREPLLFDEEENYQEDEHCHKTEQDSNQMRSVVS